jgi:fluoroacetyl-CoA thioesterase
MKETLEVGLLGEKTVTVTREMGVEHLGDLGRVLSTPAMIEIMEHTCLEAMQPHLDPGEGSVGTMVHVWHRAAAAAGEQVVSRCRLLERDRRRCLFEVTVDAGERRIGDGTHERFVIELARFSP